MSLSLATAVSCGLPEVVAAPCPLWPCCWLSCLESWPAHHWRTRACRSSSADSAARPEADACGMWDVASPSCSRWGVCASTSASPMGGTYPANKNTHRVIPRASVLIQSNAEQCMETNLIVLPPHLRPQAAGPICEPCPGQCCRKRWWSGPSLPGPSPGRPAQTCAPSQSMLAGCPLQTRHCLCLPAEYASWQDSNVRWTLPVQATAQMCLSCAWCNISVEYY